MLTELVDSVLMEDLIDAVGDLFLSSRDVSKLSRDLSRLYGDLRFKAELIGLFL